MLLGPCLQMNWNHKLWVGEDTIMADDIWPHVTRIETTKRTFMSPPKRPCNGSNLDVLCLQCSWRLSLPYFEAPTGLLWLLLLDKVFCRPEWKWEPWGSNVLTFLARMKILETKYLGDLMFLIWHKGLFFPNFISNKGFIRLMSLHADAWKVSLSKIPLHKNYFEPLSNIDCSKAFQTHWIAKVTEVTRKINWGDL